MNIEITTHRGFCFGVRRALAMARETKRKAFPGSIGMDLPIFTFGPLVHNPQVQKDLENEGIQSVESLEGLDRGFIIIRSHGAPPDFAEEASRRGLHVVDATCPLVKKIHRVVRRLREKDYGIVIVGHRNHPEVIGIMGHAGPGCIVLESAEELKGLKVSRKTGLVVQTTAPYQKFAKVALDLIARCNECRVFNTICFETGRRQKETRDLARRVELMIVVGGRSSSNTGRLCEICEEAGTPAHLVEPPADLDARRFAGIRSVGIISGASTPEKLTEEVKEAIQEMTERQKPGVPRSVAGRSQEPE
jgi:(E)-4-hydroxy-3-methyl-but-2-enyl pyrophosphate reductase